MNFERFWNDLRPRFTNRNKNGLKKLNLDDLESRRNKLCLKFGKKAEKHEKFTKWFKPNTEPVNTRQEKFKYCDVQYSHDRFFKSPLSFLTRLLNSHYSESSKWLWHQTCLKPWRIPLKWIIVTKMITRTHCTLYCLMLLLFVTYHLEIKLIIIIIIIMNCLLNFHLPCNYLIRTSLSENQ